MIDERENLRDDPAGWCEILALMRGPSDRDVTARRLGSALAAIPDAARRESLDRLLERLLQRDRAYGLALLTLAEVGEPDHLELLAARLHPLPGALFEAEEAYLAELVRLVAGVPETAQRPVVTSYLLERPISSHWHTVTWALWPRRKELFGEAWERFFSGPRLDERATVLEPFLATPAAVLELRKRIEPDRGSRWRQVREALKRLATRVTWLSEAQRVALERSLE